MLTTPLVFAETTQDKPLKDGDSLYEYFGLPDQSKAINDLNKLNAHFSGAGDLYPNYDITYPDYFAGMYINDDGNAVVLVTDDSPEVINAITEITGNDNIIIELKTYSFNELLSTIESLNDFYMENQTNARLLNSSFKLNEIDNTISMTLPVSARDQRGSMSIEKVLNGILPASGMIEYEYTDNNVLTKQATVQAGSGIGLSTAKNTFSAGYKARWVENGVTRYGFVTAAHAVSVKGEKVYSSAAGAEIGVVKDRQDSPLYGLDVAFIEMGSNHTFSRSIAGVGLSHATQSQTIYSGMTVFKKGMMTSSYTHGKITTITSNFFDLEYGSGYIVDFAQADYASEGGDSGGIVFTQTGGDPTYAYPPVGIHGGRVKNEAYFVKESVIRSEAKYLID